MSDKAADGAVSDERAAGADEGMLSLDTALELVADQRRRFALYTLVDSSEGVVTLHELFEDVATLAAALDQEALTRDRYFDIASDLYHWHLPVLADVGVISCDPRNKTIRYLQCPTLDRWVQQVRQDELP